MNNLNSHQPSFNLGLDLTYATPTFNLPAATAAMPSLPPTPAFTMPVFGSPLHSAPQPTFSLSPLPNTLPTLTSPSFHSSGEPHSSGSGVVTGLAKVLVKDQLPPAAKTVGVAASAVFAARKLVDQSEKAILEGQSPAEAYTCQTANVLTEEVSGKVMKGAVVSGIIPYLEAAVAFPPLAVTIPAVAAALPEAYKGASTAAHSLGRGAEDICHSVFDQARQLSNGGK